MDIKDYIRAQRIAKGYTMKQLADAVGVSEATVSRWESGEINNMKRSAIIRLVEVLDIPINAIMGWDMDEDPEAGGYYVDRETAELAKAAKDNPDFQVLLDANKKLSPEAMKDVLGFIKYQLAKERGE